MLVKEHRGAFEYDWRTRFGIGLSSLPESMDWGEAWRMALVLVADPTSQVCAAVSGWHHSLSWEGIALRDLYDLQHKSKAKNPRNVKSYPRPWDRKPIGKGTALSADEYQAIRARHMDN